MLNYTYKQFNLCPICDKEIYQEEVKDIHHIFNGPYKKKSEKYGFLVNVHRFCHRKIHDNYSIELKLKVECQEMFENNIGDRDKFIKEFGQSYIDKSIDFTDNQMKMYNRKYWLKEKNIVK